MEDLILVISIVLTVILFGGVLPVYLSSDWAKQKRLCKKEFKRKKKLQEIKDVFGYKYDANDHDPILITKQEYDGLSDLNNTLYQLQLRIDKLDKKKIRKKQ